MVAVQRADFFWKIASVLVGFEFAFMLFLVRNRTLKKKKPESTFSPLFDVFIAYGN